MKRCEYCGAEYPDDTTVCTIDRQPLAGDGAAATMAQAETGVSSVPLTAPKRSNTYVPYPEYRWSARDAWKYLGMGVVFHTTWYVATSALGYISPDFYRWHRSPVGHATMTIIYAGLWVLTAAYFARTETIAWFCQATGLNKKPTGYVWFGIEAALAIVEQELKRRRWKEADLKARRKGDKNKLAIAVRLRKETTMTLKWIAERLWMGSWNNVSNLLAASRNRKQRSRYTD